MVSLGRTLSLGLFLAALGLGATPPLAAEQKQPIASQQAQGQAVDGESGGDEKPRSPAPAPKGQAKGAPTTNDAPEAQSDYDEANLQVQGRMADYTAQSVQLTKQALHFTQWAVGLTTVESLLFIVTTIFTVLAVKQAKRGADIAQRSLEAAERPHILVSKLELEDLDSVVDGAPIRSAFRITNHGNRPAMIKRVRLSPVSEKPGVDPVIEFTKPLQSLTWPLAPGAGWGFDFADSGGWIISGENIADIKSGALNIYVFGRLEYADIAGRPHHICFVYQYNARLKYFAPFDHPYWEYT